jgi:hypothetical protein
MYLSGYFAHNASNMRLAISRRSLSGGRVRLLFAGSVMGALTPLFHFNTTRNRKRVHFPTSFCPVSIRGLLQVRQFVLCPSDGSNVMPDPSEPLCSRFVLSYPAQRVLRPISGVCGKGVADPGVWLTRVRR